MAGRAEADDEAAVLVPFQRLVGVEVEARRVGRRTGREPPDDLAVLRRAGVAAEGAAGVGGEVLYQLP